MSGISLKPCPFCGGGAFIHAVEPHKHKGPLANFMQDYEGGIFIECRRCTCAISAKTEAEAIEAWNTRKQMEQIVQQLNNRIEEARKVIVENPADKLDKIANDAAEDFIQAYEECLEIIKEGEAK